MLSVSLVKPEDVPAYLHLAFPRHRRGLLDGSPDLIAVGAGVLAEPWGLVVARVNGADSASVEAVAVAERSRGRGVATRLLAELESELRARGVRRVQAAYRQDRQYSSAVQRILERQGFEHHPDDLVVELRYSTARLLEAPRLNIGCPGAVVVPNSRERFDALLHQSEASGLAPSNVSSRARDPAFDAIVEYQHEVAACALGYGTGQATGHLTMLYVRREFRRVGLAGFTARAFVARLIELKLEHLSCEVRLNNSACLPFADDKLKLAIDDRRVVHTARKHL